MDYSHVINFLSKNKTRARASVVLLVSALSLVSCTTVHSPAPVLSLDTNVAADNVFNEISGDTYKVQTGDTLFAIALYSGNDYRELAKLNNISPPYSIIPNQIIRLTNVNTDRNNVRVTPTVISPPKYTKVVVDHTTSEAYGGSNTKKHRKKYSSKSVSSNKSDYNSKWTWPASGKATTAIVGSDGSIRGLDIIGSLGSPILAAKNGKVVYAGNALKGYGNLVIIKHDNDYLSAYAHNKDVLVSEQAYVTRGQKIATMGRSGSNEVRLHFEIREKGKSLDPLRFLPTKNKD